MGLMRLNFLATYLHNLGLRDTTQVVEGMSFEPVLHRTIPSGFLSLFALQPIG